MNTEHSGSVTKGGEEADREVRDTTADHGDIILGHRSLHSSAPHVLHGKERTNERKNDYEARCCRHQHPDPKDSVSPLFSLEVPSERRDRVVQNLR